jgi:hypothetical protein
LLKYFNKNVILIVFRDGGTEDEISSPSPNLFLETFSSIPHLHGENSPTSNLQMKSSPWESPFRDEIDI